MFRSGAFVAAHLDDPGPDQVQPNGVDLTLDAVFEVTEPGLIARGETSVGDRQAVLPEDEDGRYHLDQGGYVVRYADRLRVPGAHVGFVYPRSSLLRNACMLHTAVWDAGYEGRGEGLLAVHRPIRIEPGARIAQFVLARAGHAGTYDGSYQGEGLAREP